jgi:beta-carotene 15,15'-dioxygenase
MIKYSNISIVASFFCLWLNSFFSTQIQIILGFALIFSFGILHGANDLLLIKNENIKNQQNSGVKILGYYVLVVFAGLFLFYIIPQIALLLFIIVSANHFGEQQWQNIKGDFPKGMLFLFQFFYGLLILLLLFIFHSAEVQNIIFKIANITIPIPYFSLLLKIVSTIFISLSAYLFWKSEKLRKKLFLEFFYLTLFLIIFKSSSLIWGFAIYFILWHSIPSIIDQIKFLNGSYSLQFFITYCRDAWAYWLISIIGMAILYYIFKDKQLFNALFFSFLAAITFPHTFVITKMFNKK